MKKNGDMMGVYLTEIEKLKSICQDHRDHAIDFKADCVRLEKENEELKSELRYYRLRDTPKWRAKW